MFGAVKLEQYRENNLSIENQQPERIVTLDRTTNEVTELPNVSIVNTNNEIPPTNDPPENRESNKDNDEELENNEQVNDNLISYFQCYCGKRCKGLRGLQAHKRACKILTIPDLKSLFASPPRCVEYSENSNEDLVNDEEIIEKISMLNGIKLP